MIERPAMLAGRDRYVTPMLWVVKPGLPHLAHPVPRADADARGRGAGPGRAGPPGKAEVPRRGADGEPRPARGSGSSGSGPMVVRAPSAWRS